jgi:hypothetical protein
MSVASGFLSGESDGRAMALGEEGRALGAARVLRSLRRKTALHTTVESSST